MRDTAPPSNPPATERGAEASPRAAGPDQRNVTLAVVTGAHGVTGEVRLKVFAEDLTPHRSFNDGQLSVKAMRIVPAGAIAQFAEVTDRNAAEALRGTELTVPRSALPPLGEGEYYHADLIGLAATSSDGAALGTVVAIDNFGAGDVIEIEREGGKRFMVPMRVEAVPEWNADRLVVDVAFVEV